MSERGESKRRGCRGPLLIVLGVVVAGIAALVVAVNRQKQAMIVVAQPFAVALHDGDVRKAYALTDEAYRSKVAFPEFSRLVDEMKIASYRSLKWWYGKDGGQDGDALEGELVTADGNASRAWVLMRKIGDGYRIVGFGHPPKPAESASEGNADGLPEVKPTHTAAMIGITTAHFKNVHFTTDPDDPTATADRFPLGTRRVHLVCDLANAPDGTETTIVWCREEDPLGKAAHQALGEISVTSGSGRVTFYYGGQNADLAPGGYSARLFVYNKQRVAATFRIGAPPADVAAGAATDSADAQLELAVCYIQGLGVEQDLAKGYELLTKAAEQGHVEAQFNAGICRHFGKGCDRDAQDALAWYRKAADQGHAGAMYNIGILYDNGEIDAPDRASQAATWYSRSAAKGDVDAMYKLGSCYEKGVGVPADIEQARKWYRSAADGGQAKAKAALDALGADR